jgi:hypothetical protein
MEEVSFLEFLDLNFSPSKEFFLKQEVFVTKKISSIGELEERVISFAKNCGLEVTVSQAGMFFLLNKSKLFRPRRTVWITGTVMPGEEEIRIGVVLTGENFLIWKEI